MQIQLTPEQEAALSKLAESKGRGKDELAKEVLGYYLEHEAQFAEAVKRGIDSLDRGAGISHAEVGKRLERLIQR